MSKHTPGPWEVDGSAKTVRAGIGVSVAFCGESGVFGAGGFQSIGTAEARANARLIASAPDLLQALIECLECEFAVTDKSAISNARAAIAKATDV